MTFLLPLVALALALAAPFLSRDETRVPISPARLAALVGLFVVAQFALAYAQGAGGIKGEGGHVAAGLSLGAVTILLGGWSGSLVAGVAGAGAIHLFPTNPTMGLVFVAFSGLGALALGAGEATALAGILVFAADSLGARHSQNPAAAFVGSQVGVALAVGAFLLPFLPRSLTALRPILVGLLAVAAGLLVGKGVGEPSFTLCAGIGAVAGVVLHFLMPDEEGESPRVGLAAVVGVALATVAFGLGRGAGLALAALAAVGVLLAVDNRCAVLALGPLVGLVLYRVLREAGTGATRALDIAQYYTLLALLLGLVLPLLPTDWLRGTPTLPSPKGEEIRKAPSPKGEGIGAFLWSLVMLATAPLVVVALGMRGGIGFVVGLGVSGLVQALRVAQASVPANASPQSGALPSAESVFAGTEARATPNLLPLCLGAGLAGGTILALSWLGDDSTLTRDAKIHLFAVAAVGLAVVAAALAFVGRPKAVAK